MDDLTIVIQAGGRSTRMGQDKGLVPFLGKTLVGYILDQLADLPLEKILITNHPDAYSFLGIPLFSDEIKDWGALGGLHAAIFHCPTECCLVLACDMPFISREYIQYGYGLLRDHDVVVPRVGTEKFVEPFRGFYRKSCLEPIESAIFTGRRRVISFFDEVRLRYVEEDEILQFDPALVSFTNVNTPQELEAAERIAKLKEKNKRGYTPPGRTLS